MKIDINVYVQLADRDILSSILSKLDALSLQGKKIMASLDDVLQDLTDEKTGIAGLATLINGLKQQIADALSGVTLPPAVQAKVDAVFAEAEARKQEIADALAANTPAAP